MLPAFPSAVFLTSSTDDWMLSAFCDNEEIFLSVSLLKLETVVSMPSALCVSCEMDFVVEASRLATVVSILLALCVSCEMLPALLFTVEVSPLRSSLTPVTSPCKLFAFFSSLSAFVERSLVVCSSSSTLAAVPVICPCTTLSIFPIVTALSSRKLSSTFAFTTTRLFGDFSPSPNIS